jgi:hypothetical protein
VRLRRREPRHAIGQMHALAIFRIKNSFWRDLQRQCQVVADL